MQQNNQNQNENENENENENQNENENENENQTKIKKKGFEINEEAGQVITFEDDENFVFEDAIDFGVFVRDVARGVTDEEFRKAFESIGNIHSAKVVKDKITGRTRGFGFVRFYDKESVQKCLDMIKKPIFQDQITGKFQEVQINLIDPKNKLFIGKIPRNFTEEETKQEIEKVAGVPLESFDLAYSSDGKSKSYGWATFKTNKLASQALKNITRSATLGMSDLFASFAQIKAQDPRIVLSVKTLFIKGVPGETREDEIYNLFGGSVTGIERVKIPLDKLTSRPLGHAIINFKTRKQAEEAIDKYQGHQFKGRMLKIEWCIPQDQKLKQKRFSNYYQNQTFGAQQFHPYSPYQRNRYTQQNPGMMGMNPNQSYYYNQKGYQNYNQSYGNNYYSKSSKNQYNQNYQSAYQQPTYHSNYHHSVYPNQTSYQQTTYPSQSNYQQSNYQQSNYQQSNLNSQTSTYQQSSNQSTFQPNFQPNQR
ncbi:heterogeneous nuclear ribonucleoprotein [Anaeramoeba ignava]|uniref:Heterogeneous nuclear ribonucleoprotein n=1 Tax=Anaeramoeba ignava TaxID=1746090 RepID=A0A9Q0R9S1_ANAIG|nr:heterogeneous nuclear ribonucleoprotein [Anaeramoeba ignava]